MKTMIAAAAARQNENVEAASDEATMMISTAETAGKDWKMGMATTAARHDADAAATNVTTATNEAVARTTNKDGHDGRGGDNERDDGNERGGGKDDERDDIVTAVEEEFDRGEITTQEMVSAVAAAELEGRRRCENEADVQGNGMEENCGKQKTEKEQCERNETQEESLQCKAKAAEEEFDRGEITTQEMVAAVAAAELEGRRRCENEADVQGNGMEENCGKQKTEKEQCERNQTQEESLQSKAKAAADCVVQAQKGEMLGAGREGGVLTHEGSVPVVGQRCFVVLKWEEESGGACGGDLAAVRRGKFWGYEESASVLVTKKDMDALLRKVKQLSEMVETAGKWLSEGWIVRRRERNEGVNPEEVVEDDAMDWEWEKGSEPSVDEQMRNLREEMAEMSLRVERLERNMPLGCEESGSSSGGGEWAWWSGAWWVKTNMRMNSASRRKVHWAISQSLGKSSERNRLCEEKTSDTDGDEARRRRKLGMEAGFK